MSEKFLLQMKGVTKIFPGVTTLDHVDLQVKQGEIHVLLGENGAGKSTLIKLIAGVERPNGGAIFWNGEEAQIHSPHDSAKMGIAVIHQELSAIGCLSVTENMFLGKEIRNSLGLIDWNEQKKQAMEALGRIGLEINPDVLIETLSVGQQQMVEVAKAIHSDAKLIIMDEPTSSLSRKEIDQLLEIMSDLKAKGISILFITHKLDEAKKVGDTVTVLKDGRKIDTVPMEGVDEDVIVHMMVGRDLSEKYPKRPTLQYGQERLRVDRLTSKRFRDVSFSVRAGEILGIFGLVGAGRTEVVRSIFGADPLRYGEIYINGAHVDIRSPADAIKSGLVLLTENRKEEGLVLIHDVVENVCLPNLKQFCNSAHLLKTGECSGRADEFVKQVNLRPHDLKRETVNFSGGNQQKIVIAKWLMSNADIFIFDEPTRGIDVGAKTEIYSIMNTLLEQGKSIVFVSSEMQEIIGMADRCIVMYEGRVTGEFVGDEMKDQDKMLVAAIGG